jgi:transcriptional regulator with PAS, ATPase and Fis domain
LRERTEDIPILLNEFTHKNLNRPLEITAAALAALQAYPWPGNIREFKNVLELAICLVQNQTDIELNHLPAHIIEEGAPPGLQPSKPGLNSTGLNMKQKVNQDEAALIEMALADCKGNKSAAAGKLGISRSSLYNKMRRYGLN